MSSYRFFCALVRFNFRASYYRRMADLRWVDKSLSQGRMLWKHPKNVCGDVIHCLSGLLSSPRCWHFIACSENSSKFWNFSAKLSRSGGDLPLCAAIRKEQKYLSTCFMNRKIWTRILTKKTEYFPNLGCSQTVLLLFTLPALVVFLHRRAENLKALGKSFGKISHSKHLCWVAGT